MGLSGTKNDIMTFNGLEMSAVTKLALVMAAADGKVEKSELAYMAIEMARFGIQDAETVLNGAQAMDPTIAMAIVEKFDYERKKYVAAYLGTMMAADGDIADKELAIWRLTSTLCGLPSMNIQEAINHIKNL